MPPTQRDVHLPEGRQDNDATSRKSSSDQASDSEEELYIEKSRRTLELKDYDASILQDEEEHENLLTRKGRFDGIKRLFQSSSNDGAHMIGVREPRRRRREKRRASIRGLMGGSAEEGQLMFEMEEGFKDTSSRSSSADSLRLDRQKWNRLEKQQQVGYI
jgi:hypothetical protein